MNTMFVMRPATMRMRPMDPMPSAPLMRLASPLDRPVMGPSDGTEQAEEEHDVPDKVQAVHDEHERAGLVRVMEATP